jgi:hypothetical protein
MHSDWLCQDFDNNSDGTWGKSILPDGNCANKGRNWELALDFGTQMTNSLT